MRKLVIGLLFLAACGAEPADDADPDRLEVPCIDTLSACEFTANRRAGSFLAQASMIADCTWDYGVCIGYTPDAVDCKDECWLTYFSSWCEDACQQAQHAASTDTSTSS